MKKSLLGILLLFIIGCSHTEPKISDKNIALVFVEEDMQFDNGYGLETSVYIDGKLISSDKRVKISAGKHVISMDITAFYNRRAKYAEVKSLSVEVKPNHTYVLKIMSDKEYFDEVSGNTNIKILIEDNKKTIINQNIILQDNRAKTIEKYPDLDSQISTILTVVL